MIPKGAHGIRHVVARLVQDLVPASADAYTAADLAQIGILMSMIGQDYERAAEVLVTEDAEISALLSEAAPLLPDADLGTRIAEAVGGKPASLLVRDLSARSDLLLRLLIEVHAAAEDAASGGAAWARMLDERIWAFLETHVARHAYEVAL